MSTRPLPSTTPPRSRSSEKILTINPAVILLPSTAYAVRIDDGAILDYVRQPLRRDLRRHDLELHHRRGSAPHALDELTDHINGAITLTGPEIAAHKLTIDAEKDRFDESATIITAVFDLVTTYDTAVGPLLVTGSTVRTSTATTRPGEREVGQRQNIHWVDLHRDAVHHGRGLQRGHPRRPRQARAARRLQVRQFRGLPRARRSARRPRTTHTATINGSFPDTFGRDTQQWTLPARKPTGSYLAPGTIATVTVPPALVGQGYQVRVGAHSWDLSRPRLAGQAPRPRHPPLRPRRHQHQGRQPLRRRHLHRGAHRRRAPASSTSTITGAVRSPYFSAKSFHQTTTGRVARTERTHPAPWADFQSDKFMMQVPTKWIYNLDDPAPADGRLGRRDGRDQRPDGLPAHPRQGDDVSAGGRHPALLGPRPGLPGGQRHLQPQRTSAYGGYADNYLVRGPGHPHRREHRVPRAGPRLLLPEVRRRDRVQRQPAPRRRCCNRKFGYNLDDAFAASLGFQATRTAPWTTPPWPGCAVFNFSPREVPMAAGEKAYQHKGHAKFMDIARLFGWDGLDAYWRSFMLDDENGPPTPPAPTPCCCASASSVGKDIRPLFHFWGIHPQNPAALPPPSTPRGSPPRPRSRPASLHYKTLVPADNAAFRTFALNWWGKQPSINGYWEEREHARQWDTTAALRRAATSSAARRPTPARSTTRTPPPTSATACRNSSTSTSTPMLVDSGSAVTWSTSAADITGAGDILSVGVQHRRGELRLGGRNHYRQQWLGRCRL